MSRSLRGTRIPGFLDAFLERPHSGVALYRLFERIHQYQGTVRLLRSLSVWPQYITTDPCNVSSVRASRKSGGLRCRPISPLIRKSSLTGCGKRTKRMWTSSSRGSPDDRAPPATSRSSRWRRTCSPKSTTAPLARTTRCGTPSVPTMSAGNRSKRPKSSNSSTPSSSRCCSSALSLLSVRSSLFSLLHC